MFNITITNETTKEIRNIPFTFFNDALNFIEDTSFYGYWVVLEKTKTYFKAIDKNHQIITAKIG